MREEDRKEPEKEPKKLKTVMPHECKLPEYLYICFRTSETDRGVTEVDLMFFATVAEAFDDYTERHKDLCKRYGEGDVEEKKSFYEFEGHLAMDREYLLSRRGYYRRGDIEYAPVNLRAGLPESEEDLNWNEFDYVHYRYLRSSNSKDKFTSVDIIPVEHLV